MTEKFSMSTKLCLARYIDRQIMYYRLQNNVHVEAYRHCGVTESTITREMTLRAKDEASK